LILNKPKIVTFDVTYKCNLACNMCQTKWFQEDTRFGRSLSKEQIIQTAQRLKKEDGAQFFRFVGAEPLLHPDILEIIREVSKIGDTWLTTNGTLITEKMAKDIISSGLKYLCISYHSVSEHYKGRSPEKIVEKTIKGIEAIDLAKKKLQSPLKIMVTNVITPDNYTEVLKIERLFRRYDVSTVFSPVHSMRKYLNNTHWNGQKAEYLGTSKKEPNSLSFWQKIIFRFQTQLLKSRHKSLLFRPLHFIASQLLYLYRELYRMCVYIPCTKPYERIGVRADGKIFACEFLKTVDMGCIQDKMLWDTPVRQELIRITQKGTLEICRQCNRESLYRPYMLPIKILHKFMKT